MSVEYWPGEALSSLVVETASRLMSVTVNDADDATAELMDELRELFGVDTVFLRRNRHLDGISELVAEQPPRENVPHPDPLGEVPFSADPVFAATAHLRDPYVAYPDDSDDYQERVRSGSGVDRSTMAMVPLVRGRTTVGVMGLVRFAHRPWHDAELRTLTAVSALLAQLWYRVDAERKLHRLALFDDLTDLPNRAALIRALERRPDEADDALLVVDIDDMKVVNDGLTYSTGNQVIRWVADRITSCVRAGDRVFRVSGDEFAVLTSSIDEAGSVALADRIVGALAEPDPVPTDHPTRTGSVGVVVRPDPEPERALQQADAAVVEAKAAGRNRAVVFDDTVQARIIDRYQTEVALRNALEHRDQIDVHYQPEYDLRDGRMVAVEALVRWHHPVLGLLPAGAFIEVAEQTGLVVELGDIVLRRAIVQLASWNHRFPRTRLTMRVNVSPAQLAQPSLVERLRHHLSEHRVPPDQLCLELTEHTMVADTAGAIGTLARLRNLGVTIALDDFGTGYSSMSQLKVLPFDYLKIDRSFVDGLGRDENDTAIVDAIIRLGDAFGLEIVAEGIEQPLHVAELRARGCYRAQGYLLSRPVPATSITELLVADEPHPEAAPVPVP